MPRNRVATVLLVTTMAALGTPVLASASAAPPLDWKLCKDVAKGWLPADDQRTECAMVTVPVDYAHPDGRKIDIAISRQKATDPAKRKGVVLLNPGGPGQAGIHEPRWLTDSQAAGIGVDHDLIGFDPRGVDYSADVACPPRPGDDAEPPSSLPDKEKARFVFERDAKVNRRCVAADPEFVRNLTTDNVARDMDRIREALGEEKIGFYGVSWGTALGTAYRTLFDGRVDRMLLDSVMSPTFDMGAMDDAMIAAGEVTAHEFAAWIARYDGVYHFGVTQPAVLEALLKLRDELTAHPRTVNGVKVDGETVKGYFAGPRREGANSAKALAALRDGGTPAAAPAKGSRAGFGWDVTPQGQNTFQQTAVLCNASEGPRDFETIWKRRTERIRAYPAVASPGFWDGRCAGWDLPVQPWKFTKGTSPLQLAGHVYEPVTPIGWALAMRERIGGALLTIEDDHHGSLSSLPCASKAVEFFSTGKTSDDSCAGKPIPSPGVAG
ncbi:alpha/beta fold hydrolase [Amycolatopsis sp. lyj-112]|uniref:alpha/beta fold hydrolase n=1 Tax=Amycolatopsis sp. lyj-112 TaxID=2789288 RepID=UPI00397853CB